MISIPLWAAWMVALLATVGVIALALFALFLAGADKVDTEGRQR